MVDSVKDFYDSLIVNTYGTFVVDACVSDASACKTHLSEPAKQPNTSKSNTVKAQYPDEGPFAPRVQEERGVIINFASAVTAPVSSI